MAAAVAGDGAAPGLALPQRQKVVLVMDLVESVRLMAADEQRVIGRWRGFVHHATGTVLPRHRGRLVKSLGDGIMAEFDSARDAVAAALQLHRHFDDVNLRLPEDGRLYLRAGLNATHVFVDGIDIYGSGVNLAARVASLAGPGETMVTAEVRDGLTEGLDAALEDMGECHLKHVPRPVRAFRVGRPGPSPVLVPRHEYAVPLQPGIAVLPFEARSSDPEQLSVGELVADGVIAQLGVNATLRVIARLSTAAFAPHGAPAAVARQALGVDYVLSGSYLVVASGGSSRLLLTASLARAGTGEVMWVDRFVVDLMDLCAVESEACQRLAAGAHRAIVETEARTAVRQPMPTVASYSLLLSGITLMHRSTAADMSLSRRLLEHLAERHPRAPEAHAWLAKSFVLNAVSSFANTSEDARRALAISHEALARAPSDALSLAVQAHVVTHLEHDPGRAALRLEEALRANPNEPLAWLFRSVLSAMFGNAADAVADARRAQSLSPVDPLSYYFRMIHASAATVAGDYAQGAALARESLRLNRFHTPTWRVLVTAQALGGDVAGANRSAGELLALDPSFTLDRYLAAGNADSRTKQQFVLAARELPAFRG